MIAIQEQMIAKMDAWLEKKKACQEEMEACLEKREANQEETEAAVETIRALEHQSEDRQPAVGCGSPLKQQARNNVVQGAPKGRTFEKR
jgi:hypothetical protein